MMRVKDLYLPPDQWRKVCLEIIDNHIHFYLDGKKQLTFINYLPQKGTHIGITALDTHHELNSIHVFSLSPKLQVGCLAIPDSFLAHKNYDAALAEYRRIAKNVTERHDDNSFYGIPMV